MPFSLRRWSQRKLAAGRHGPTQRDDGAGGDAPAAPTVSSVPVASPAPDAAPSVVPPATLSEAQPAVAGAIPLPPLESLTIDSDFSPFMQPGVDEALKRSALRTLLRHPRFNVMDGLDVYIDDYSKPSPLEPEIARTLMQARYIFDPPPTRVTAEGTVEDVPPAEGAVASADGSAADTPIGLPETADRETQAVKPADAGHEEKTRVPAAVPTDESTR